MKKLFTALVCITFITPLFYSQTNWYTQNSGTSSILQDVFFVDQDYGWIAGAHLILHTTDGGNTWIEQPAPPVSNFYIDIYFIDRMNGWACGNESKIIHTTDGGSTWVSQPNPYTFPNPILYGIYFANADTGWAAGGDHGTYPTFTNRRVVLYTSNGGSTWDFQYSVNNKTPLYCVSFANPDEGFAASESGDIVSTSNGGSTWTEKSPVSSYRLFGIDFINATTGWVSGEYLGVPHVSSISKTTDGGSTWITQTFGTDEYLQEIYFIDELTGWAVGGTIGGSGGTQHSTILHTTDGGNTWQPQNSPTTSTLLSVDFSDPYNGWAAGVDGTVLKGTNVIPVELTLFTATANNNDAVLNWRTATETNNKGFEVERSQRSKVKSQKEWERIGFVGGHGTTTQENNYAYTDENLEAGNYSYRLVQIDFDGTRSETDVVNVEINNYLSAYKLRQNYPNPFNPTTTISYSIPQSGNVQIKVFSSIGEQVSELVNEFKNPGNYEVKFDAATLPSGIYYYRINAGSFNSVKKMILLK